MTKYSDTDGQEKSDDPDKRYYSRYWGFTSEWAWRSMWEIVTDFKWNGTSWWETKSWNPFPIKMES